MAHVPTGKLPAVQQRLTDFIGARVAMEPCDSHLQHFVRLPRLLVGAVIGVHSHPEETERKLIVLFEAQVDSQLNEFRELWSIDALR